MPAKNIIPGQIINPEKLQRARELRKDMTPAEKILWQTLRGNQLGGFHFRRQQIISGFIVDFFCHAADLVVEVDGGIHAQQREYDAERDIALSTLGLHVLHFSNQRVEQDSSTVCREILSACLGK